MFEVQQTEDFSRWLHDLADVDAKAAILMRIARLGQGNAGDVAPVGEGVSELRVHVGPGYRAYYMRSGRLIYLMLAGGDKSTQERDIAQALKMARALRAKAKATKPRKPK
ncbi:MAG: type II toxin-antitoxin system RelE/ParE family toxin [Rubrivivax sp.]